MTKRQLKKKLKSIEDKIETVKQNTESEWNAIKNTLDEFDKLIGFTKEKKQERKKGMPRKIDMDLDSTDFDKVRDHAKFNLLKYHFKDFQTKLKVYEELEREKMKIEVELESLKQH